MCRKYFLKDMIYLLKYRIFKVKSQEDKKGSKFYIFVIALILLLYWSFSIFETKIRPTVVALAEAKAKVIATNTINMAVNEGIVNKIKYEDLVSLNKDSNNRITALQMNIVKMNEIQALTSKLIQDKLSTIDNSELSIPVGNILNSTILAGWGPKINIQIMPIGTTQSEFKGNFMTAGINQTKHRIELDIKEKVVVVVPLVSTSIEVTSTIPIAETVIVGDVPQTYLDISGADSEEIQKAKIIAPSLSTVNK